MACSKTLMVAAIDFGTTYSGVAFSFKHEYERDPRKVNAKQWFGGQLVSLKGATSVLITSDGNRVDCFGFDAETKYAELCVTGDHKKWYYFRRFKMMLHGDLNVKKDVMLEDVTGKKLSAMKIFSLCIGYLKSYPRETADKQLVDGISDEDIHWVLTVPAIWNDTAKQFMRKAAENAGIDGRRLSIALEPEAASIYCRYIPVQIGGGGNHSLSLFKNGSKYIVLDAGGGTVDVTVHEVTITGDIKELHRASGGAWGGTKVDDAFEELLRNILGNIIVDGFKRDSLGDYLDLFQDFEIKKRKIRSTESGCVTFKIPSALETTLIEATGKDFKTTVASSPYAKRMTVITDKLRVDADIIKDLFLPTVNNIVKHVRNLLQHRSVKRCDAIVMVGGFSESPILQEHVRNEFRSMNVIIPDDAGMAVLRGAVIFGHNPDAVTERVCKFTYGNKTTHTKSDTCTHPPGKTSIDKDGTESCEDIFTIHARKGHIVKLGEKQKEICMRPKYDDQTKISMVIYTSPEKDPCFVTDKGCQQIGQFYVPIKGGGKGKCGMTFLFGGTEIEVEAEEILTGKITKHRVKYID